MTRYFYDSAGHLVSSQPDVEFDDAEREWFKALKHYREVTTCRLCGLPKSVCRDYDTDGRVVVDSERCHVTAAILRRQRADERAELDLPESMSYDAHVDFDAPPLGVPPGVDTPDPMEVT